MPSGEKRVSLAVMSPSASAAITCSRVAFSELTRSARGGMVLFVLQIAIGFFHAVAGEEAPDQPWGVGMENGDRFLGVLCQIGPGDGIPFSDGVPQDGIHQSRGGRNEIPSDAHGLVDRGE